MNIKEKLQKIGIDVDNDKKSVNKAKKALLDNGIKVDRIISKIDEKSEKIIEEAFKDLINKNNIKKSIVAPPTKKQEDDVKVSKNENSNVDINLKIQKEDINIQKNASSKEVIVDTNENKNEGVVPFWKNNLGTKNIKIKIKGKETDDKKKDARPLPQSTIEEFEKKKQAILDKNKELNEKKLKEATEEKNKNSNSNINIKVKVSQNVFNQNNKNNQHDNNVKNNNKKFNSQNNLQQNHFNNKNNNNKINNGQKNNNGKNTFINKNQKPNYSNNQNNKNQQKPGDRNKNSLNNNSINKNIILNQGNATLVTGTNNRFDGKKKDKAKYNKDFETQNKQKTKQGKKDKHTLTTSNYQNMDEQYRKKKKTGAGAFIKPEKVEVPQEDIKSITLPENIIIKDFAQKLRLQPSVIIKKLFLQGKVVTVNDTLSYEEAENFALEYDILCEKEKKVDVIAELLKEEEENEEDLVKRPPIVCVMGHVDHGKTSILDAIRKTNVIEKEAGGITQHIGAYQVNINDRLITFLDTPGHEAFTAMRLRGAKSTDIAVLVVAADDGVMPQTIEAINHAKAANVEVIVCINKIDKPEANPERIKKDLSNYDLIPEDWGGKTIFVETSAKQGIGIQNLLEMILLTSDVLELKANPNRKARGIVIESELDKGKGPVARILVQKGTMKTGDFVAMGSSFGKVRAMMDYKGKKVDKALPSTPVEILGLNGVPQAGDTFVCFDNEKEAKSFAETFISENKIKMVEASRQKVTLEQLFDSIKKGEIKELPIVLKADVAGSTEAVKQSLEKLSNEEVQVKVIHEGVGNISESDVSLAAASNAIIIGFNIKIENNARNIISREKIDVRLYDIIYKAIEDVEKAMKGMFAPVYEEKILGELVIRQIFKASNVGNIAGCFVNNGEIRRNCKVRVKRNDKVLFDGDLSSLKRFKDEVKEVKAGYECGVVIDGFNDVMVDDIIQSYIMEEKKID